MHSIEAIGAVGSPGLGTLTAQLPWAWFALMAVVDVALVVVIVARRRAARAGRSRAEVRPSLSETVLRHGWSVPRSRAFSMPAHPRTYAWPLHSEYMVSRLV